MDDRWWCSQNASHPEFIKRRIKARAAARAGPVAAAPSTTRGASGSDSDSSGEGNDDVNIADLGGSDGTVEQHREDKDSTDKEIWDGDLSVKKFDMESKTFRIVQGGRERTCRAGILLEHRLDDALHFLYKHFCWCDRVTKWIKGSRIVRKKVGFVVDLRGYALQKGWEMSEDLHSHSYSSASSVSSSDGDVDRDLVGGLDLRKQGPGVKKGTAPPEIARRELDFSKSVVDQVVETPPPKKGIPTLDVGDVVLEEEDESPLSGPISPRQIPDFSLEEEDEEEVSSDTMIDLNDPVVINGGEVNRGEDVDDDDDEDSMTPLEVENICVGTHRWEEAHLPSYACGKGVLTGRSCFHCRVCFVDGVVYPVVEKTWKVGGGNSMAHHCMNCNVCACNDCRNPYFDMKSPPRRAAAKGRRFFSP